MNRQYKIINIAEIMPHLSEAGILLMGDARTSLDKTKVLRCINHPYERIKSIFKPEFDLDQFMSSTKTYSHEEALGIMNSSEWSAPLSEDL